MKYLLLSTLLLTGGCRKPLDLAPASSRMEDTESPIAKKLGYFQDPKTGVCFASLESMTWHGFVVISFTAIACEKMPKDKK